MPNKRVIAVLGATGAQGGSLCEAILNDPAREFVCRAIARDPDSDAAKALADKGAEISRGDLDDEASLTEAFAGAHSVYGVTNWIEISSVEREQRQATNIARAAKAAGAEHVIWSTLEDTAKLLPLDDTRMPTLMGKYKCPHSDSKGQIDHVFEDLGLPVTFLLTSFYWDNFYKYGWGPKKIGDGVYALTFPVETARMAGIAVEDIGKCALGIFKAAPQFIGRRIGIAGEHLSGMQMAEKCCKALGIVCKFYPMSPDAYRQLGFPGADDLGNTFQLFQEFEQHFTRSRDVEMSRALAPSLLNFDQWLEKYKDKIVID